MPPVLHVPAERDHASKFPGQDLGYEYPKYNEQRLNLVPGSELHERIKSNIVQIAQDSYDKMKRRHPYWERVDETLTTYIALDEEEEVVKRKDIRRPVSIVVPYTYATLETLMTYLVSAFFELPIFRYQGVTSDDVIGAAMLEEVVRLQVQHFKSLLSLHTLFRDGLAYGVGISNVRWDKKKGWKTRRLPDQTTERTAEILFEGNRIENIDPYLYLPDPSVPIHQVQRGEYVGWFERSNYVSLLEAEALNPSIFNIRYLEGLDGRSTIIGETSGREKKYGGSVRDGQAVVREFNRPMDIIWMYVNLIPSSRLWGLGDSGYPEKWLFGVAADNYVIAASPTDLDHNNFPVEVCAPDFDGYSLSPISRMEQMHGMQGVLDFLFNSHVANVRKAINDMFVVDPFLINTSDLKDPSPGKFIRTRKAAWGRGVKDTVMQLAVSDVTRQNIQDSGFVVDLMQRTSAAVDSLMGIMRSGGERRSATEARDTRMSALSRLSKTARIVSIMTMYDMSYLHASHTQQLMSQDVYATTMGRMQRELEEEYGVTDRSWKVTPDQIDINYDILFHDGSVYAGESAQDWVQLFQILATQPAIGQGFDMVRVFKHIARVMGVTNVNDFVQKGGSVNIKTAQMDEILAEKAKGSLRPVEGPAPPEGGEV